MIDDSLDIAAAIGVLSVFLDDGRHAIGVSRLGAANAGMRFVFARVTEHLCRDTARTPNGATQIFASIAPFFGNLVSRAERFAGTAQTVNGPQAKEEIAHKPQHGNPRWRLHGFVGSRRHGHGRRVDNVGIHQQNNDRKGATRLKPRTGFTQPSQVQALNRLAHGNLGAPKGAAQRWMTDAFLVPVAEAILPFSSGDL